MVESLMPRSDAEDAIVIEIGLPGWTPSGAATYVRTYGAARVNVENRSRGAILGPATRGGAVW